MKELTEEEKQKKQVEYAIKAQKEALKDKKK